MFLIGGKLGQRHFIETVVATLSCLVVVVFFPSFFHLGKERYIGHQRRMSEILYGIKKNYFVYTKWLAGLSGSKEYILVNSTTSSLKYLEITQSSRKETMS